MHAELAGEFAHGRISLSAASATFALKAALCRFRLRDIHASWTTSVPRPPPGDSILTRGPVFGVHFTIEPVNDMECRFGPPEVPLSVGAVERMRGVRIEAEWLTPRRSLGSSTDVIRPSRREAAGPGESVPGGNRVGTVGRPQRFGSSRSTPGLSIHPRPQPVGRRW